MSRLTENVISTLIFFLCFKLFIAICFSLNKEVNYDKAVNTTFDDKNESSLCETSYLNRKLKAKDQRLILV